MTVYLSDLASFVPRGEQRRAEIERELVWYFAEARAALQPRSNFGAMCAAIGARGEQSSSGKSLSWQVVKPSGSHGLRAREEAVEIDERLLEHADRERPVRRVLAAVGGRWTEVLEVGCVGESMGLEAFGSKAALAPLSRAARRAWLASGTTKGYGEWLVRLSWRVRTEVGAAQVADRLLAREIAQEAVGLWREALAAFLSARDRFAELERAKRMAAEAARAERMNTPTQDCAVACGYSARAA